VITEFSLPVEKKILLHLSAYSEYEEAWEVPYELLNALKDDGMVLEKLKHVKGLKRRRKAYFLTDKGSSLAQESKDSILGTRVTYVNLDSKARTENLSELVEYLKSQFRTSPDLLEVLGFFQLSDPFDCMSFKSYLEKKGKEEKFVAYTEKAPLLPSFVGREKELNMIKQILDAEGSSIIVVQGIGGIGKTYLGVKLLEDYRAKRHTFWYRIREFDSIKSVAVEISEFLALQGKRRLNSYIRGKTLELGRLSDLLEAELKGENALLIFDNFQNASVEVATLFSIVADVMTRIPNLKLALLTRHSADFYEVKDAAIRKLVRELRLEGLDPSSAREFLSTMQLSEEQLNTVYELTKGMPLFLELIRNLGIEAAISDLRKFIEKAVFFGLKEDEKSVLECMTVFRYALPLELLLSGDIEYDALSSLLKKSIIVEYPGDLFEVHDAIREHLYRLLNRAEKKRCHKQAAEIYLKSSKEKALEDEESAIYKFEVIYHLEKAEEWSKAFNACANFVPGLMDMGIKEVKELLEHFNVEELSDERLAEFLVLRGDAHALNEDWESALKDHREALRLKKKLDLKEDLAQLHSGIAQVQRKVKRWSDTLKSHRKALKLFKELGDKRGMAREFIALGMSYKNMKRFDKALEMYNKSLELFKGLEDDTGMGATFNNMAILHASTGNWRRAKRSIEKSLEFLKGSDVERAKVLYNFGGLLEGRGLLEDALKAYEESQELFGKSKNDLAVKVAVKLGDIHFSERNYDRASECYQNAMSVRRSTSKIPWRKKDVQHDKVEEQIKGKLIDVLRELGDWQKCAELLSTQVGRLERTKERTKLAIKYLELGLAFENLGRLEDALDSLRESQSISEAKKDLNGLVAVNLNLGRILRKKGDDQSAKECYTRALESAKKVRDKAGIETALLELKKL